MKPLATQPISVLHVSTPLSWRGGEQQLTYLFEALEKKGINQWLYCPTGSELATKAKAKKWQTQTYKKRSGFDLKAAFHFAKWVKKQHIDLLHAHDAHAHTLCILAGWFGLKTPIVLHRRVDFPIKKSIFTHYKYNHPRVKKIICVSDAIKLILQKDIHNPERALTIHSAIDTSKFKLTNQAKGLHKLLNLNEQTKLIGNASALADHKDYLTFLRTAQQLLTTHSDLHFVVFGEGELRSVLEDMSAQLGLSDKVHFMGFRNDLTVLLPQLDVFLFTSKTEGLGTTLLDAIACKLPIVATAAGGVPEIVIDNKTGLLCLIGEVDALAKGVIQVLENSNLRNKLINGATAHLANFTIANMSEQTLEVYRIIKN